MLRRPLRSCLMALSITAIWVGCLMLPALFQNGKAAGADPAAAQPEPAPPEGQTFIGTKRCSACHIEQFTSWKKTKHASAFDDLTAKYQADAKCLKCHTTGFGEATGFKDPQATPTLENVSCEICHGPGSKHEEIAKSFMTVKKLSPEQEKSVRDSIWKLIPKNVCVECHNMQAHKESQTPPELRKK